MELRLRSVKLEEFDKVIELINYVFRILRNYKLIMMEEFFFLLSKNNIENMIIILEDDKVVFDVNYLI